MSDYQVVVPRKVSEQGQLISHDLTHHYDDSSRRQRRRRRRQVDDTSDDLHYRVELSGREKQLHLKPNDRLLASSFVVERRRGRNITDHRLVPAGKKQCHYVGQVKGHPESTVAVSTCNGLVSRKLVSIRPPLRVPIRLGQFYKRISQRPIFPVSFKSIFSFCVRYSERGCRRKVIKSTFPLYLEIT